MNHRLMKNSLSEEQVIGALKQLGSGPPLSTRGALIFDTVCHNDAHCGSKKLYYYLDSKMFKCYTGCGDFFDIFQLISRAMKVQNKEISASDSMYWLYKNSQTFFTDVSNHEISETNKEVIERELTYYDDSVLNVLRDRVIKDWIQEGIKLDSILKYKVKYNPVTCAAIIPHFDIDNRLIGIRQRTLVSDEERHGKYRPAYINGNSYPHPLSYNLYGLNFNKNNVENYKKAFVFEGEKSVLLMDKYPDSCAVATCGSSISAYQVKLLMDLGVDEIIVAFDKEFIRVGDEMYKKQAKMLSNLFKRFSDKVTISFIFDQWNLLGLKDSPIDKGIDIFNYLLSQRFTLEKESLNEV